LGELCITSADEAVCVILITVRLFYCVNTALNTDVLAVDKDSRSVVNILWCYFVLRYSCLLLLYYRHL